MESDPIAVEIYKHVSSSSIIDEGLEPGPVHLLKGLRLRPWRVAYVGKLVAVGLGLVWQGSSKFPEHYVGVFDCQCPSLAHFMYHRCEGVASLEAGSGLRHKWAVGWAVFIACCLPLSALVSHSRSSAFVAVDTPS